MARPRKNDPSSLLQPIIEQFVEQLAFAVEKFTVSRIADSIRTPGLVRRGPGRPPGSGRIGKLTRAAGAPRGIRPKTLCYYPGCQNIAAPRFGMFCAVLHKNLPQAEKDKYRAQHAASGKSADSGATKGKGESKPSLTKNGKRRGRPPGRPPGSKSKR